MRILKAFIKYVICIGNFNLEVTPMPELHVGSSPLKLQILSNYSHEY